MANRLFNRSPRIFTPTSWIEYFDEAHDIYPVGSSEHVTDTAREQNSFRVYLKNFHPPFAPDRQSGTQISNLEKLDIPEETWQSYSQTPTLVTIHGAGYSGLTWAPFSKYIQKLCKCRILSVDLRNHGDSKTDDDDKMDIDTMVNDVIDVIHATHRICGFSETPKIILIGHSMGGAIAIKCSTKCLELLPSLAGFVIIDVVEGTAKDALPLMMSVIQSRPTRFSSLDNAIEWSVRSGMAKNIDAARVSMPSNLLNIKDSHLGIHDIPQSKDQPYALKRHKFHISIERLLSSSKHNAFQPPTMCLPVQKRISALRGSTSGLTYPRPVLCEDLDESSENNIQAKEAPASEGLATTSGCESKIAESKDDTYMKPPEVDQSGYCWRTDLSKTEPFWNDWFDNLSEELLNAPVQGKFLLLAGIDRLDRTLTIGQMQGKFMMKVLPKCGHAVHEDAPQEVANEIGQFLVRNKFTTLNN